MAKDSLVKGLILDLSFLNFSFSLELDLKRSACCEKREVSKFKKVLSATTNLVLTSVRRYMGGLNHRTKGRHGCYKFINLPFQRRSPLFEKQQQATAFGVNSTALEQIGERQQLSSSPDLNRISAEHITVLGEAANEHLPNDARLPVDFPNGQQDSSLQLRLKL